MAEWKFELPQTLGNVHPAISGLPLVDTGVTDAVLAAKVSHRKACLVLLQDGYDLLFRKPTTLHVLVLKLGQNELQTGLNPGGKVILVLDRIYPPRNTPPIHIEYPPFHDAGEVLGAQR